MNASILPGTEDLLKLPLSFKNHGNSRSLGMDSSRSHYIITETSVRLTEALSLFYGLVSSGSQWGNWLISLSFSFLHN